MNTNQRMNTTEAAKWLAEFVKGPGAKPYSPRCLYNWTTRAGLPHFRDGREIRFDREQLNTWATRRFARNQTQQPQTV